METRSDFKTRNTPVPQISRSRLNSRAYLASNDCAFASQVLGQSLSDFIEALNS